MDNKHCLIVICTPCYNIVGLAVDINDNVRDIRYLGMLKDEYNQLYVNKMVAKFGFLDKEDYDSSYYNIETSFTYINYTKMFGYSSRGDIGTRIWCDIQNNIHKITAELTSHHNQNIDSTYLLYMPTIEELRSVRGFKSINQKYLWFCSDWGEDTN